MTTMTYAAPVATMMTTPGQAVYSISPERFQLILQGQPLTNEEIAAMTGAGLTGGSIAVAEVAVPTASVVAPPMNTETDITHEPQPEPSSKTSSKKSPKKNSKKKLSSKKKEKGCC